MASMSTVPHSHKDNVPLLLHARVLRGKPQTETDFLWDFSNILRIEYIQNSWTQNVLCTPKKRPSTEVFIPPWVCLCLCVLNLNLQAKQKDYTPLGLDTVSGTVPSMILSMPGLELLLRGQKDDHPGPLPIIPLVSGIETLLGLYFVMLIRINLLCWN
jgi:hypothetical protein